MSLGLLLSLGLAGCKTLEMNMRVNDSITTYKATQVGGEVIELTTIRNWVDTTVSADGKVTNTQVDNVPGIHSAGYSKARVLKQSETRVKVITEIQDQWGNRFQTESSAEFKQGNWSDFLAGRNVTLRTDDQDVKRIAQQTASYMQRTVEQQLKAQLAGQVSNVSASLTSFDLRSSDMVGNLDSLSSRSIGSLSFRITVVP